MLDNLFYFLNFFIKFKVQRYRVLVCFDDDENFNFDFYRAKRAKSWSI